MRAAAVIVLSVVVIALLPLFAPYDPYTITPLENSAPDFTHWLGTDSFGRDVLSRLMHGAPITLGRASIASLLVLVIGGVIGAASGAFGRWVDSWVVGLVNVWLAFPSFVVALIVITLVGQGELSIVLAVAASQIGAYTQYARAVARSVRHEPYIQVARSLGATRLWVFWRHIVPNALPQLIGYGGVIFAYSILTGAALTFVGLVGEPAQPEWGAMLADGRRSLRASPWVSISAGAALTLAVLTINHLTARLLRHE